jgi:hypothetical protein
LQSLRARRRKVRGSTKFKERHGTEGRARQYNAGQVRQGGRELCARIKIKWSMEVKRSREQKAERREQTADSRQQIAESRERRAERHTLVPGRYRRFFGSLSTRLCR